MRMIKIAVLCPSEIAFRRFMPALKKVENAEYLGIGVASEDEWFGSISSEHDLSILNIEYEKAEKFKELYGGKIFNSYSELLNSSEVDAVYIPLPPALHYKWVKEALKNNKHVFVEKPSTTSYKDTFELVELANEKQLALHENYMFNFHSQIDYVEQQIKENILGEVRLYRIAFGFPFRGATDFRYSKKMGGGSLLDCGGYTLKLATRLLGEDARLVTHQLNYKKDFEVDIYGSGTLVNSDGDVAQISFGMDNTYKCELEIWGEKGRLYTNRIFTAPEGYNPMVQLTIENETKEIVLDSDDTFKKSLLYFIECVKNEKIRKKTYSDLLKQSSIVDEFMED